jgi:VanZ family protein
LNSYLTLGVLVKNKIAIYLIAISMITKPLIQLLIQFHLSGQQTNELMNFSDYWRGFRKLRIRPKLRNKQINRKIRKILEFLTFFLKSHIGLYDSDLRVVFYGYF